MDNLAGEYLGRYRVIEPLGQGGMASVYKAFDTSLERNVAIKIIRTGWKAGTEQSEFLKRFQREARALAQLDHPNILRVLDYGEQEGMPYLVMPFVPGGTLNEKMGHPMPYREAAALLESVAQALDYAHQRKIIHRDVKPANILLGEANTPILSDFGIAKILETGESTQLTTPGVGIGTPDYMAPEQWMGKTDPRTDIYSLGVVFFQLVTGRLPFTADTPAAVLIKHMREPLPRPSSLVSGLPEAVEQVLFKALAKEPESRFQTMGAFADALGKLALGDQPGLAAGSQATETIQATIPAVAAPDQLETLITPATVSPARKGIAGRRIGLIVVAVVAGVMLIVVLGSGAYIASTIMFRSTPTLAGHGVAEGNQTNSTVAGPVENTPRVSITAEPPTLQPHQTSTIIPFPPMFTADAPMFCRDGPGTNYGHHWQLNAGETVPVLAKWFGNSNWLLVDINNSATRTDCCWVSGSGQLNVSLDVIKSTKIIPNRMDCSAVR